MDDTQKYLSDRLLSEEVPVSTDAFLQLLQ